MTQQEKYKYWVMLSDYDIDTVKVLYEGQRWTYVTYVCQQAVERLLKGMYVYYTGKEPPKTHNVSFIFNKIVNSDDFNEVLENEQFKNNRLQCEEYLVDLMFYYISDYPFSYKKISERFVGQDIAASIYEKTLETLAWLKNFQTI